MANEQRLIDANALRERMFSYYGCVNENTSKEYYRGETLMNYEVADLIEDCIDNATTVDAVEVVRCKDCKRCAVQHNHITLRYQLFCTHGKGYPEVSADDFCSYGERKDDHE